MDYDDFVALDALTDLTPDQIAERHPDLFRRVQARLSDRLKSTLEQHFEKAPENVRRTVSRLEIRDPFSTLPSRDVAAALSVGDMSDEERKSGLDRLAKLKFPAPPRAMLHRGTPLAANPLFATELRISRSYRIAKESGVAAETAERLVQKGVQIFSLKDDDLSLLVKNGTLKEKTARTLGRRLGLYRLLDEELALVDVVEAEFGLGEEMDGGEALRALSRLDTDDWEAALERAKVPPPPGVERRDHARLLERKVAALYPTATLGRRLGKAKPPEARTLDALKPLFAAGRGASRTRPDDLDLTGVEENAREVVKSAHAELFRLVARHPGLRLEEIAEDAGRDARERVAEITKRIDAEAAFRKANAERDLLSMNLAPGSDDLDALDFDGVAEEMRPFVLSNARAHQRAYGITGDDALDAATLLSSGYAGAIQVARMTESAFLGSVPFAADTAKAYYRKALSIAAEVGIAAVGVHDAVGGGLGWLGVGNIGPDIGDYFRKIDGWEEYFGAQTFCDCPECASIIGPASYFVDLMKFVEEHILDVVFTGDNADNVLSLRERRPDLWTLQLTCENTNTEIPLLVAITEIFERYIARREGFAGPSSLRARFVYRDRIASRVASFDQPMVLPHEILQTYLGHFKLRRDIVLPFVAVADATREAIRLGLPREVRNIIAQASAGQAAIERIYGADFIPVAGGSLQAFDSQVLVSATGIDRPTLGRIVASGFVTDRGADTPQLRSAKRSANSVQNDIEHARNFTFAVLDRMHRFVRLLRATELEVEALDAIDAAIREAGRGADMTAALGDVADIVALATRFGGSIAEAASVMRHVSTQPDRNGETLLDRRFNADYFLERAPAWPSGEAFVHAAHALAPDTEAEFAAGRLRGGLKLSEENLVALIEMLAGTLGAALDGGDDAARSFDLDADNLGHLYRHAKVMSWLKLDVDQLERLIELAPGVAGPALQDFDDVLALIEFADRVAASGVPVQRLGVAAGRVVLDGDSATDPEALGAALVKRIADGGGIEFADTLFSAIEGVSEGESRQIVAANPGVIEAAPTADRFRLVAGADLDAALALPAGIAVAQEKLAEELRPHHVRSLLAEALAGEIATTRPAAEAMITASGLDTDDADVTRSLRGETDTAPLLAALSGILRLAAALPPDGTPPELLEYAARHLPLFGAADVDAIDALAAMRMAGFAALGAETAMELAPVLEAFDAGAGGFAAADVATLGAHLVLTSTAAQALNDTLDLPANALDALGLMQMAAGLTVTLGVTAQFLADAASDDYDNLDAAASAIVSAMRVAHSDDAEWKRISEPYEAEILNAKRDGLVAFLIHSIHPELTSVADLYRYFLLDPDVDGCFPTSRVVAAISSVQAYVHRILMNLEQSEDGDIAVSPALIPRDEWEWRKNFRVWQANRKVFLWTENYLDPDFRDNETHLYEEFKAEVLQNELDEQAIFDAYSRYMEGFEVLANLSVAGSYHAIDDETETDVLHLIGVTPGDPPTFFYRTVENLKFGRRSRTSYTKWNNWQPINVKIPVREVSPVVHDGRLHLFWVEIVTTPQNEVHDAGSRFIGYKHKLAIKFSTLRIDGEWTVPQSLSLYQTPPFGETNGVVDDPLAEPDEVEAFRDAVLSMFGFGVFSAESISDAVRDLLTPRYDDEPHTTARDGYTLATPEWTRVHPESTPQGIRLSGVGYQMRAMTDLFDKDTWSATGTKTQGRLRWTKNSSAPSPVLSQKSNGLYFGQSSSAPFDDYAWVCLAANESVRERVIEDTPSDFKDMVNDGLFQARIANLRGASLHPVNGSLIDVVIDRDGDLLLFQGTAFPGQAWLVHRIGTTLSRAMARTLFTDGVGGLLATARQELLGEAPNPIQLTNAAAVDGVVEGSIDFRGPFGTYYREIFFHVPFLVARTLQAQGNHLEAKRWYEYIFDPTTTETVPDDPALSDEQNAVRKRDRTWRFIEFRNLGMPQLRQILTDPQAIAAYKGDPFNPHAIARLRLSAYQKSVVMCYVDNLLDWGDKLFTQFQQEPINEAIVLYQTARDILGPRPVQIGDCGLRSGSRSYQSIKPALEAGSDFLAEMENVIYPSHVLKNPAVAVAANLTLSAEAAAAATWKAAMSAELQAKGIKVVGESHVDGRRASVELRGAPGNTAVAVANIAAVPMKIAHAEEPLVNPALAKLAPAPAEPEPGIVTKLDKTRPRFVPGTSVAGFDKFKDKDRPKTPVGNPGGWKVEAMKFAGMPKYAGMLWTPKYVGMLWTPKFLMAVLRTISPIFCVPGNKELLDYWKRVEDRLYKIHNCLDINGNRRQLSLFAPEIDPRALIRAKAAGLSTDDVLAALNGAAPPLRFPVLLQRAKEFAGVVQSFGNALQAALERKDGEELNRLRLTQQQDVLAQTTRTRLWEYNVAVKSLESTLARQTTLSNALARLEAMHDTGLIGEEVVQRIAHHTASGLRMAEATLGFLSGALALIPQIGSPFAMKYGGQETNTSAERFAIGTRATADFASALASMAALEATFSRRAETWSNQIAQQKDQLAELEKEVAAAELRRDVAERAVSLHELAIEQAEEVQAQAEDKFSDLGFYTWAAQTLQRVHRDAYNCALSVARMAENAFRFERGDQVSELLGGDYWSGGQSGLHAGAKLTVDLQNLERLYMETTPSSLEIDQSFSLFQMDPAALMELKRTGTAAFDVDERFFDLFYPGQFRRLLKAVRITIPSVTGPNANVSATLTLEDSFVRADPAPGAALQAVPAGRGTSVATSTAQNDAGVFELSFNGQKYLPFEGAGAISRWRLTLPSPQGFPPFDYRSISDVLLRLSYTAEFDGALRAHVETENAALAGTLAQAFRDDGLQRVISLRQEHSDVFQQLVAAPLGTPVDLVIGPRHFPIFVAGRELEITGLRLAVETPGGAGALAFSVGGNGTAVFGAAADLGGLPAGSVAALNGDDPRGTRPVAVTNSGALAGAGGAALDASAVRDILVVIDYSVGARA